MKNKIGNRLLNVTVNIFSPISTTLKGSLYKAAFRLLTAY